MESPGHPVPSAAPSCCGGPRDRHRWLLVLAIIAVAVIAGMLAQTSPGRAREETKTMTPTTETGRAPRVVAPLDQGTPARIETATFALG